MDDAELPPQGGFGTSNPFAPRAAPAQAANPFAPRARATADNVEDVVARQRAERKAAAEAKRKQRASGAVANPVTAWQPLPSLPSGSTDAAPSAAAEERETNAMADADSESVGGGGAPPVQAKARPPPLQEAMTVMPRTPTPRSPYGGTAMPAYQPAPHTPSAEDGEQRQLHTSDPLSAYQRALQEQFTTNGAQVLEDSEGRELHSRGDPGSIDEAAVRQQGAMNGPEATRDEELESEEARESSRIDVRIMNSMNSLGIRPSMSDGGEHPGSGFQHFDLGNDEDAEEAGNIPFRDLSGPPEEGAPAFPSSISPSGLIDVTMAEEQPSEGPRDMGLEDFTSPPEAASMSASASQNTHNSSLVGEQAVAPQEVQGTGGPDSTPFRDFSERPEVGAVALSQGAPVSILAHQNELLGGTAGLAVPVTSVQASLLSVYRAMSLERLVEELKQKLESEETRDVPGICSTLEMKTQEVPSREAFVALGGATHVVQALRIFASAPEELLLPIMGTLLNSMLIQQGAAAAMQDGIFDVLKQLLPRTDLKRTKSLITAVMHKVKVSDTDLLAIGEHLLDAENSFFVGQLFYIWAVRAKAPEAKEFLSRLSLQLPAKWGCMIRDVTGQPR